MVFVSHNEDVSSQSPFKYCITFVSTFQALLIFIVRSFILKYSSCFLITYQFPEVTVDIISLRVNRHVPVSLSQIMSSDLFQKLIYKLNFWFDNIVTLLLWRLFLLTLVHAHTNYPCLILQPSVSHFKTQPSTNSLILLYTPFYCQLHARL
jgi:hypothetical protein